MTKAGSGSRGIVFSSYGPGKPGYVFNVVNQKGTVRFLKGGQSREYLETGNLSAQLAGNAPFIIDKDTGEVYELGTAYPLVKYLQDYEDQKNNISGE